jgi:hypothetical protein
MNAQPKMPDDYHYYSLDFGGFTMKVRSEETILELMGRINVARKESEMIGVHIGNWQAQTWNLALVSPNVLINVCEESNPMDRIASQENSPALSKEQVAEILSRESGSA